MGLGVGEGWVELEGGVRKGEGRGGCEGLDGF